MATHQIADIYDSSKRDEFKMAIDSDIDIREIMQKELDKRYKNTLKNLEQYIDFNGETSK